MENHHAINGKTHYFDWAIFNSKLLNYQRVLFYAKKKAKIYMEKLWKNPIFDMLLGRSCGGVTIYIYIYIVVKTC